MKGSSLIAALAAVALLGASRMALAQDKPAPPAADAPRPLPQSPAASRLDRPVRVRASHRVDVIAPGERVETVLDRMRSATRACRSTASISPIRSSPTR